VPISKPMLADTPDSLLTLVYPLLATPKLDGIRCLKLDGRILSRKFKDIPNDHIRQTMESLPDGLDGELMVMGSTFNEVQSAVMSVAGQPNFIYYVFDYVSTSLKTPYSERMIELKNLSLPSYCIKLLPVDIANYNELLFYEESCLADGFEGVMVRKPDGPYKCGRSTVREGLLLKIKQFKDSEAEVIGFEEQLHNANKAEIDELGHTKRSKAVDGLVLAGTLGKFIVREVGNTPWKGKEFAVGTGEGLTAVLRKKIWENQAAYIGKLITYKYQPHGVKDLPRLPIWKGFRDRKDM
jgi:DNA ligase-1